MVIFLYSDLNLRSISVLYPLLPQHFYLFIPNTNSNRMREWHGKGLSGAGWGACGCGQIAVTINLNTCCCFLVVTKVVAVQFIRNTLRFFWFFACVKSRAERVINVSWSLATHFYWICNTELCCKWQQSRQEAARWSCSCRGKGKVNGNGNCNVVMAYALESAPT